jgi:hypothetical protein
MWLYYLVATLYVITCLVLMLGGPDPAGQGRRSGLGVRRRQQPGRVRRARRRDAAHQGDLGVRGMFVVCALALSIIGQRGPGSVLGSVALPKPAATQPLQRHLRQDAGAKRTGAAGALDTAPAQPK